MTTDRDEADELPVVSASEHELVMVARALVAGPGARDGLVARLGTIASLPPTISPACARLLADAARHLWLALWQRGGTRAGSRARAWERHAPVALVLSPATLELLRWLVSTPAGAPRSKHQLAARALTIGDELVVYLALDALAGTPFATMLAAQPFVQASGLAWLGFVGVLVDGGAPPAPLDFGSLTTGVGAIVVEGLGPELATRWRASATAPPPTIDPRVIIALGVAQDRVLDGFMATCDRAHRRDLAGFVVDAAAPVIRRGVPPAPANVAPGAPLAVRAEAHRAAGSLLRAVMRWSVWDQQHRGVRFIDDDYAQAQQLLARFERIGPAGVERADGWLAALSGLDALAGGGLAPTPRSDTIEPP